MRIAYLLGYGYHKWAQETVLSTVQAQAVGFGSESQYKDQRFGISYINWVVLIMLREDKDMEAMLDRLRAKGMGELVRILTEEEYAREVLDEMEHLYGLTTEDFLWLYPNPTLGVPVEDVEEWLRWGRVLYPSSFGVESSWDEESARGTHVDSWRIGDKVGQAA